MSWFKRKKARPLKSEIREAEIVETVERPPFAFEPEPKYYLERIQDGNECGLSFEAEEFSKAHTEENLRHFKAIRAEVATLRDISSSPDTTIELSEKAAQELKDAQAPEPAPEPPKQAPVSPPKPKRAPVPSPVAQDLAETTWAVTERGKQIKHTEAEVTRGLSLLVLNGGMVLQTQAQLEDEGITVSYDQLRRWKTQQFPHKYLQIRKDLSREVGEKVAGDAMEIAQEITEAERAYLEKAMEKVDEVPAEHLAKNVAALAQAKSQNVERAQTLRHEPNVVVETRDVATMLKELENLNVLKKNVIDVESEEIE